MGVCLWTTNTSRVEFGHGGPVPALASDDPPGLDAVVTWAEALAAGLTAGQVDHRLKSGRWRSLARGVYLRLVAEPPRTDGRDAARLDHAHRAVAAALRREGSAICLRSAAVLHGLPTVGDLQQVEIMVPPGGWAGRRGGVRSREVGWNDGETIPLLRRGPTPVQVTSAARTVVDVARSRPLVEALMVGDHALREGLVGPDEIDGILEGLAGKSGVERARQACALLDGRRESALESVSWGRFVELAIPLPTMQHRIFDAHGFVARGDFYWEEFGLVGEADGVGKVDAGPQFLHRTLMRHDRIVASGRRVVRWGWPEVYPSGQPLRRLLEPLLLR